MANAVPHCTEKSASAGKEGVVDMDALFLIVMGEFYGLTSSREIILFRINT